MMKFGCGGMKKCKVRENAYFSLEACLIMPIVFCTIVFLIYIGFYQYDKCLLRQDVFRMMIRGGQVKFCSNEEVAQKIREEDAKWYYEKYVLCNWGNKKIEVGYDTIRIEQQAAMKVSVPILLKWTGREVWGLDIDISSTRIHPTDTIRAFRKIEKVAERGNKNDGMGICSADEP